MAFVASVSGLALREVLHGKGFTAFCWPNIRRCRKALRQSGSPGNC
ncbi:MAG: hypothetical protein HND56_11945 [Pseudomonadota bacterium]|nr:MAG: hypothetical protein HND56_11945 [Pseudomonadota bacterium]